MELKTFAWAFALFATFTASTSALAAPYSTTYTGTIGTDFDRTQFPELREGERYTATVVVDNGGASALSQTWAAGDVQCVIFTWNDAADVSFADNVVGDGLFIGSMTTDAAGDLTGNYEQAVVTAADNYTSSGFTTALVDPISWYMNNANNIFMSDNYSLEVGDAAGGVQMAAGNWSAPVAVVGSCSPGSSTPAATPATPVPALPLFGLLALGGLVGLFGLRKLKK